MSPNENSQEPCGLSYQQLCALADEDVMSHLAAGHGDAVAVLLDRYSRLVRSVAYKIVHDPAEAEDVAQEVFVDLCRTAVQFDAAKGTTKMWIVRTAYRRSLTRRRNIKTRDAHLQGGLDEFLNLSAAPDCSAAPRLSFYESRRLASQVLSALDGPHRRVLEMVFFDGLTLRDVAERTGTTLESVRHRYYRGIEKLRKLMREEGVTQPIAPRVRIFDAEA